MPADATADVKSPVAQLATRYANLVYRAAVRRMGGQGKDAEDVTQAVFLIALQKSKTGHLPEEPRMAGWLLQITQYAALQARRGETRRHHHESAAAAHHPEALAADPAHELPAALDDALLKLRPLDRELLARRYLQNQPVNHVAAALNIPENTASQRLHRALEKLRKLLTRPGTTLPAATLTTLLLTESAKAIPASLALTAASATGSTAAAVSIAKGAATMLKLATLKTAAFVACGVLALLAAAGITLMNTTKAQAPSPVPSAVAPISPPAPALAGPADNASAEKLLDAAIKTLSDQEKSLKNITATGVAKSQQLNLTTGQWEDTGEYDMTATFAMPGLQKCRIDCPLSKSLWIDGAAPFYIERYILLYDGKVALKLFDPDARGFSQCEIDARRPYDIDQAASACGCRFTSLGWQDPGPERLLDFLKARRNTPAFHAERVIDGGRECLKVSLRMVVPQRQRKASDSDKPLTGRLRAVTRDHWLDVKMGFALTRYEQHNTIEDPDATVRDLITDKTEMRDFTEPMPGFFYPRHVDTLSLVNYIQHEKPDQRRATVDISTVKTNTAIDDDTFNPEKADLTGGATSIRNPTTDKQVLIRGGTTEQDYQRQQKQLKQLVDEARANAENSQPASQPTSQRAPNP